MNIRIIGAALVICGGGMFGILTAANYRRELSVLQSFFESLKTIEAELLYRKTPLPSLCRFVAQTQSGVIRSFYSELAAQLESQICPGVQSCVQASIQKCRDIPGNTRKYLFELGKSLGQFDMHGQISEIQYLQSLVAQTLTMMKNNQTVRIRSYQTLGLCAGAAIAILLI